MLTNFGARCAHQNPRVQLLVRGEVLSPSVTLMRSVSAQCPQNTHSNLHNHLVPSLILQKAMASETPKPQLVSPLPLETPSGWLRFRIHRWSGDGHMGQRLPGPSSLHPPSISSPHLQCALRVCSPVFHCPLDGVQSAAHIGQWCLDGL